MEDLKNKVITFEEFKVDLLQKAKDADACYDGYGPAEASETKEELLKVIKDNITWCFREGVLTTESLSAYYSESELAAENIYISGRRQVKGIAAIALGNSTVEAWDNSTVKAWGNSTVEALGNSTVEALDNSTVKGLKEIAHYAIEKYK